ncbi:MAG: hypothetical protein KGY70_15860, partial [Bacteroidales bacterium]|nr:hypothetical protein [Bacteroidales bacterium]
MVLREMVGRFALFGRKPAHDEIKGWWENINKDAITSEVMAGGYIRQLPEPGVREGRNTSSLEA